MLALQAKKVVIPETVLPLLRKERSFLDREGVRILASASNREALALHERERADLIVAMLDDPDMSGEELCSRIREDERLRKVSVIIICADTEADHERCLACRANSFVSAPVSMAVLLQEAHHLLNVARRADCRIAVDVEMRIDSSGEKFTGRSENLSSSGMLIETDAALNEGDTVACTFTLPEAGSMTVEGMIVREEESTNGMNRYGVSFVEPDEDVVKAIDLYAREHGCE